MTPETVHIYFDRAYSDGTMGPWDRLESPGRWNMAMKALELEPAYLDIPFRWLGGIGVEGGGRMGEGGGRVGGGWGEGGGRVLLALQRVDLHAITYVSRNIWAEGPSYSRISPSRQRSHSCLCLQD